MCAFYSVFLLTISFVLFPFVMVCSVGNNVYQRVKGMTLRKRLGANEEMNFDVDAKDMSKDTQENSLTNEKNKTTYSIALLILNYYK